MVSLLITLAIGIGLLTYNYGGAIIEQAGKIDLSSILTSDAIKASEDTIRTKTKEPINTLSNRTEKPSTGKFAFMNKMKPALYKDLDKIFSKHASNKEKLTKAIKAYYRGLMNVNDTLDNEQCAEVDRVFGDYVKLKKEEMK